MSENGLPLHYEYQKQKISVYYENHVKHINVHSLNVKAGDAYTYLLLCIKRLRDLGRHLLLVDCINVEG
jgi:hypothetical protein